MKHKQRSRYLVRSIIALVIFTAFVLAAMFGLTWAVVYALKDTKVRATRWRLRGMGEVSGGCPCTCSLYG